MKFSIVTITYNRAHLIGETIESVLQQTYQDFEHIIIDDGSTDNTEEIIKNFNDKRIKYFKYKKIGLRSYLRNEGIRKAKGELITILDSDDIWYKNKLREIHTIFSRRNDVNFIIHNIAYFQQREFVEKAYYYYKKDFFNNIFSEVLNNKIKPFSIYTFRKSILNTFGLLDENLLDGQHDFYLRISLKNDIYYLNKTLTYIRKHDQNLSLTFDIVHLHDMIKTLDKLKAGNNIDKTLYIKQHTLFNYKIAVYYIKNKKKHKGLEYLNKVIRQTPFLSKLYTKSQILKFSISTFNN